MCFFQISALKQEILFPKNATFDNLRFVDGIFGISGCFSSIEYRSFDY